ncbi:AvaB protein [Apiospora arundinis]|uniref:AvaB protein n=1 Tax=Apiospora arundinis TaxID=335852 RepID=A0ABR2IIV0_9PEZI
MLSAFTARPIIELKPRDKSKIETILANGDRVLVGLNTGSLRVYRLNNLSLSNGNNTNNNTNNGTSSQPGSLPDILTPPSSKAGPPSSKPTDLLREVEKFSTRAVEQLAIIKEANTLISLSNYHVSLYDLQTYELIETIQRTKNASCFAVTSNIVKDGVTGIPEIISRLAVAVKRRLLLWSWHESELGDEVTEIVLPEAIRSITWATATKIVCGMNAGFVLVDVETSTTTEIAAAATAATGQASRFGAASMGYMGLGGYMPKPLAAKLAEGGMLLAKDINTLFIDAEGKPVDKRQIPWQSAPDNIGYSYPYILALQPPSKGALEVRNPDTLSLLQNLNLPGAAQLHFPPPTYSLAHAGKGFHISSDRCVWKMDATDYDSQISDLIQQGLLDEAISVLGMLEDALLKDKTGTMREVKMRKAEVLFKAKRYRESMDLFNEDEVRAPPERVLKLFPRMIAGDLSWEAHAEDDAAGTASETDNNEDEEPSAEKKTNGDDAKEEPIEAASPSQAGTGAFSKYWPLGGGHKKTDSDAASIMSTKRGRANTLRDDDASSIKGSDTASVSNAKDDGPLSGDDLKSAVGELRSYLAGTRARLQRYIDPVTGKLKRQASSSTEPSQSLTEDPFTTLLAGSADPESDQQLAETLRTTFSIVDTALFRAYMYSTPALAPSLFRIANFCDPKVVNEKLLESHRYNDLVEFFNGKKLHREALTLLRRFGTASEEPNGHGENSAATAVNDAHDGAAQSDDPLAIPINPSEIPRQLRGPQRTVMYLQALPPDLIDLILEFAEWVLRRDPDLGMDVFLADSENAETLPRERVLKYLEDIDEKLEIRYLEHIIGELGDATPDFHNRLAELFIKVLKDGGGGEDGGNEGEKAPMMERLIKFLRESRQYSLSKAYGLIPRDDPAFYEAQAVILSNMGSHKQALDIYVFKMQDYVKAEEYCNRIHKLQNEPSRPSSPKARRDSRPSSANLAVANQVSSDSQHQDDPDATPSIYHTLLSLYLTPAPPHQTNLEPALDLLSKHGSRLPAASTLSLIPDDLPTKRLESYFSGRIRAANSRLVESRVVEGLRKTLLVDTQATLLLGDGTQQQAGEGEGGGGGGRNRRVVIGEERVCTVCHKRLGNSVVAVLPDNGVVHYGCLGRSVGKGGKGQVAGSWGRSS